MDGLTPGSFPGQVPHVARGPWFKELWVEDDGLDKYYQLTDENGDSRTLLSANVAWKDRDNLDRLYRSVKRSQLLIGVTSAYLSFEFVYRTPRINKLGWGLRLLAFAGIQMFSEKVLFNHAYSSYYGPLFAAYYQKYASHAKEDLFDIRDEKREYFEIDTSQYMEYDHDDLHHSGQHYHAHHGPQPDGEVLNGNWFREMDKHLRGEESNVKNLPQWRNYEFEYTDKGGWPTSEDIQTTFTAKGTD